MLLLFLNSSLATKAHQGLYRVKDDLPRDALSQTPRLTQARHHDPTTP